MRLLPVFNEDLEKYEEEILYVDGGLQRHEYYELYWPSGREDIISDYTIVKKDLAKMIKACENMLQLLQGVSSFEYEYLCRHVYQRIHLFQVWILHQEC